MKSHQPTFCFKFGFTYPKPTYYSYYLKQQSSLPTFQDNFSYIPTLLNTLLLNLVIPWVHLSRTTQRF